MYRLCKDSNTQMCRLQLHTGTAHFQANHVPGCTLCLTFQSSTDLIWASSLKFRISLFLISLLKPVSCARISFSSLKTPGKIILYTAVSFMWRIQVIHEIICNLCVASFPLHKGFDLKNWFVLGNSQMFIQESFDLNKKLSRLKTSVLTL